MTQAITITRVLEAISRKNEWVQDNGRGQAINRKSFRAMMIESELINNARKINEWYDNLLIAGYVRPVNQNRDEWVPAKVAAKLNVNLDEKISRMKVKESIATEC